MEGDGRVSSGSSIWLGISRVLYQASSFYGGYSNSVEPYLRPLNNSSQMEYR